MGIGPFYEREEWNNDGVPDDRLPSDMRKIAKDLIKLNFYISAKQTISEKLKLEGAFYYQDAFENLFEAYRIGASAGSSYQITEHVAFGVQYRMLYDDRPVVPVDKIWYNTYTELQVTF
ncbi:MAG TPA: hypothetical protein PKL31_02610 [Fulvivirga sp.]|nr:hypothetical protein [Fulvivirga sp.]